MGFQAVKGIAGERRYAADRTRVAANSLWYQWDRIDYYRDRTTNQIIDGQMGNLKGEPNNPARGTYSYDKFMSKENVQTAAKRFPYLLLGNEWNLSAYSDVKQCQMLHQAIGWARDPVNGNPNVRIVAPNESLYAPGNPNLAALGLPADAGVSWLSILDTTYSTLYGKRLSDELWAVGVHHYYEWGWSNFTSTIRRAYQYAQSARPGIKVWLTEWGSTSSTWKAFSAMQTMRDYIIPRGYVNAYFFFFTYQWPNSGFVTNLYNSNGSLTLTGQRYKTTLPAYRG